MPTAVPRRRARAAFTPAAAALLVAAPPASAPGATLGAQDLIFTVRSQNTAATRAEQQGAPVPGNVNATVRMSGPNARLDFPTAMPLLGPGGYMLVRGADQQLVMVNARDRQATLMAADALGSRLGALTSNALVEMTVRDQRFAFEDLGPGEPILGQPTRRVRIQNGSTTEMRAFGRTERTTESSVAEHWIAPRPAGVDAAALRDWSRGFTGAVRRTNAALSEQMAEYHWRFGDGLTLGTVLAIQLTDGKERVTHDTVRAEVVEMSRGPLDAALFTVPAGYQAVDTRQVAAAADSAQQARRAAGDTASLADDLRKTAGESVRDNAEESVRGAVGGMFRKRRP